MRRPQIAATTNRLLTAALTKGNNTPYEKDETEQMDKSF